MKIDAKINIDVRNGERRSIELQQNSAIEGNLKNENFVCEINFTKKFLQFCFSLFFCEINITRC